ncbi:unnamed protein product [Didymodactylos carnosus]|uniref:Uncharacterized protein n=1 Tax=Didymodactylos carnosus TaxID=1234261 RepID=A0A8S2K9L8_9BILA|nr:unnamed protein product [Didymodactylos carnosus]CAF3840995.1 unnamed protein product [Didymodactylos carnosus]
MCLTIVRATRLSIVSRDNDIYIDDTSTHRIVKYTSSNPALSVTVADLNRVTGRIAGNGRDQLSEPW